MQHPSINVSYAELNFGLRQVKIIGQFRLEGAIQLRVIRVEMVLEVATDDHLDCGGRVS